MNRPTIDASPCIAAPLNLDARAASIASAAASAAAASGVASAAGFAARKASIASTHEAITTPSTSATGTGGH